MLNALIVTLALGQVQLMPADQVAALRAMIPPCAAAIDVDVRAVVDDERTIWYDDKVMPPAYQLGAGIQGNRSPLRFADATLNVSDDRVRRPDGTVGGEGTLPDGLGGNANVDFPWMMNTPGGTSRTVNVRDAKAVLLPEGRPVVMFPWTYAGLFNADDRAVGWDWVFPSGTVFLEVLIVRYKGHDYVFEVRIAKRMLDSWDYDLVRPFNSPKDLDAGIRRVYPHWFEDQATKQFVASLRQPRTFKLAKLEKRFEGPSDDTTADDRLAFSSVAKVDPLPKFASTDRMHDVIVERLLTQTEFVSALGEDWNPANEDVPFSVVPPGYDGHFAGKDANDCNQCHEHCTVAARDWDRLRGWYGLTRGSRDGRFSFVPVDPATYKGQRRGADFASHPHKITATRGQTTLTAYVRPEFAKAGIVEKYDQAKHPASVYRFLNDEFVAGKRPADLRGTNR